MTASSDVDGLRRRLAVAEERVLNLVDAVVGAEAAAAQARRDVDHIFHRLHLREQELKALKEMLGFELDTPLDEIARGLGPVVARRRAVERRRATDG